MTHGASVSQLEKGSKPNKSISILNNWNTYLKHRST